MKKIFSELSLFFYMNDHIFYCYETYKIRCKFVDNWQRNRIVDMIFYFIDKSKSNLIIDTIKLKQKKNQTKLKNEHVTLKYHQKYHWINSVQTVRKNFKAINVDLCNICSVRIVARAFKICRECDKRTRRQCIWNFFEISRFW